METTRAASISVVVAAASVLVAGCQHGANTGVMDVTAFPCLGPRAAPAAYTTVITVKDKSGREIAASRVQAPFRHQFTVRPGVYRVSAPTDHPVQVAVRRSQTSAVQLRGSCL